MHQIIESFSGNVIKNRGMTTDNADFKDERGNLAGPDPLLEYYPWGSKAYYKCSLSKG